MPSLPPPIAPLRLPRAPILGALFAALFACGDALRAMAVEFSADEQQLALRLTGDPGQRRDRARMRPDPILTSVARARAEDMAHRRYFSHVNLDGLGPNFLVRAAGYELPSTWGGRSTNFIESIGAGYATPEQAWEGWMRSSPHRTHLLASKSFYRNQTNFGIGSYSDPSSPYRRYWVIITAPPSVRGDMEFVSRRYGEPARVAVAIPMARRSDAAEGRTKDLKTAPRSTATRAPAAEKLWNWNAPVSAPRPRVTRITEAG